MSSAERSGSGSSLVQMSFSGARSRVAHCPSPHAQAHLIRRLELAVLLVLGGNAVVGQVCKAVVNVVGVIRRRGDAQHTVTVEVDAVIGVNQHPAAHVELTAAGAEK